MRSWPVTLTLPPLLLLAACAGSHADSAGDASKRQWQELADHQWSRFYDDLYPAQRAQIPRSVFESCAEHVALPPARNFRVQTTSTVRLPPTWPEKTSTAVTLTYDQQLGGKWTPETNMVYEVKHDGRWYGTITDDAVAAYAAGKCPA